MWSFDNKEHTVNELVGKTLIECSADGECVTFITSEGEEYRLEHNRACCESVTIDDICGELSDLIGTPLTQAEEVSSDGQGAKDEDEDIESFTWIFYKFATVKGYVTIKFYDTCNGYYSESVDFERIK